MPVRNGIPFLTECIDSIISQTFNNWELIVVNDHSVDGTENFLKTLVNKHYKITLIQNNGKGIIEALKTGFGICKGKYITRMDADDLMPLNKLELMHQAIIKNPDKVVTGKVEYINNLGEGYINYQNWLNKLVDNNSHYSDIYRECVIPSPCWMMEKTLFEKCGGFDSIAYPEDYDLVFRWYINGIPVLGLKHTLHIWRDHLNRASRTDENYSDNSFLKLKINYFFIKDYNNSKTLFLWGGGGKAKNVAKLIISNKRDFLWGCNNINKIGHNIYNKTILSVSEILNNNKTEYQAIITVSNKIEQKKIKQLLKKKSNIESFWFC